MNTLLPLAVVLGIAIVGLLIFVYVRDQREKGELRGRGVTVTARVTSRLHDVQASQDPDNYTSTIETYHVSYTYVVNGQTYSGHDSVSRETYDILSEGQQVEVVYLPENPDEVRLASSL